MSITKLICKLSTDIGIAIVLISELYAIFHLLERVLQHFGELGCHFVDLQVQPVNLIVHLYVLALFLLVEASDILIKIFDISLLLLNFISQIINIGLETTDHMRVLVIHKLNTVGSLTLLLE